MRGDQCQKHDESFTQSSRISSRSTMKSSRCTMNSSRCTMNSSRCTMNSSRCTMKSTRCTMNSSRISLCSAMKCAMNSTNHSEGACPGQARGLFHINVTTPWSQNTFSLLQIKQVTMHPPIRTDISKRINAFFAPFNAISLVYVTCFLLYLLIS